MVMVTWLGEDESHPEGNGPKFNTWGEKKFEKGKAIELHDEDDKAMIEKAKTNRFYQVAGEPERKKVGRPSNAEVAARAASEKAAADSEKAAADKAEWDRTHR